MFTPDQHTFEAPALSATLSDEATGLRGWVVADNLVGGRAMGGTRMTPGVTDRELAVLARTMTYKLALSGLPIGGAKAGIASGLPRGDARERQLSAFGRLAAPLLHGGIYLGSDQGIGYAEREIIHRSAGFEVRTPRGSLPCSWTELWNRCEDVTGYGVDQATTVIADVLGLPQERRSVAIHGFGVVGRGVARGLSQRGFRIVAVADHQGTVFADAGLPVETLLAATDATGTINRARLPSSIETTADPEGWLHRPAELLVLAAVANAVNEDNAHLVRARAIIEGANNPCSHGAILALHDRGVAIVPGIVANSGGATVSALFLLGLAPELPVEPLALWCFDQVRRRVRKNCSEIARLAAQASAPMHALAYELAHERLFALRGAVLRGETASEISAEFNRVSFTE